MDPHRAPATGDAAKEAVRQGNLLPAVAHMAVAALEDLDAGPCSPAEADRCVAFQNSLSGTHSVLCCLLVRSCWS